MLKPILVGATGTVLGLFLVAVVTLPSDITCINIVAEKQARDSDQLTIAITEIGAKQILDVENHVWYKEVRNKFTGQSIAFGCFGVVIPNE